MHYVRVRLQVCVYEALLNQAQMFDGGPRRMQESKRLRAVRRRRGQCGGAVHRPHRGSYLGPRVKVPFPTLTVSCIKYCSVRVK